MNSFDYDHDGMETQEADGIASDTRLRTMAKAFRTINLCIALFFLLWVMLLRLPFAVRILAELLRRLLLLPLAPLMISLFFGVLVATVMVQSYRLSPRNMTEDNKVGNNFYGELNSTTEFHRSQEEAVEILSYEVEDKVVYEDKEIVTSYDCDKSKIPFSGSDMGKELDVVEGIENQPEVEDDDCNGVVLENQDSRSGRDVLSDADFKKIVDAFIKKQRDFLKLEKRCGFYGESHVFAINQASSLN